jgi:hypothetical protein
MEWQNVESLESKGLHLDGHTGALQGTQAAINWTLRHHLLGILLEADRGKKGDHKIWIHGDLMQQCDG